MPLLDDRKGSFYNKKEELSVKEETVKKFKERQWQLACQISGKHGGRKFSVGYENMAPSAFCEKESGNWQVENEGQLAIPAASIRRGKNRIVVIMRFDGKKVYRKRIGKVMKCRYDISMVGNGFEVRSYYALNKIAQLVENTYMNGNKEENK